MIDWQRHCQDPRGLRWQKATDLRSVKLKAKGSHFPKLKVRVKPIHSQKVRDWLTRWHLVREMRMARVKQSRWLMERAKRSQKPTG